MICPKCASEHTLVLKTVKELKVLRWRKCSDCNYSFVTEEKPVVDLALAEYNEIIEKDETNN